MPVSIEIVGADASDLAVLRRMMAASEQLRGVELQALSVQGKGAMGGTLDLIQAAVEPGGVLTVLAGVLGAWLQSRRRERTDIDQSKPIVVSAAGALGTARASTEGDDSADQIAERIVEISGE